MPSRRPRREELDGLLAGIRHRVARRTEPLPAGEATLLRQAESALDRGDLGAAERGLIDLDRWLDDQEEEVELYETPRGLVEYVPVGAKGAPLSREEDPVANRLLLVQRLLEIRRAQGREVAPLVRRLHEAEEAYRTGDRATAQRIGDEVHAALDEPEETAEESGAMDP